ncbi:TonB-dependent receptor, partial [Salmonella enterica subsp. enterica serovar Oslo]|nr:TonB-dependent receptor [Salmonella enterica subsp. enterica serovar Oslo]
SWQATMYSTHTEVIVDIKMMYIDALVDKETGTLVSPYGASYPVVGCTGCNSGKRKVDAIYIFADGAYELFGRQHNMMFVCSYRKHNNSNFTALANVYPDEIGNFSAFNCNFPKTHWAPQILAQEDTTQMKSLYAATRISLADPLHLILGSRYTNWR